MDFHCCIGANWKQWGRKNKAEFPFCNWREAQPSCFAELRKCSKSQSFCSETNYFWGIPCDNSSHSFHSLHSPRWREKEETTTVQQGWWDYIFCWRSLCIYWRQKAQQQVWLCVSLREVLQIMLSLVAFQLSSSHILLPWEACPSSVILEEGWR